MRNDEKLQFHLLDGNGRPCGVFDYAIQEFIKEKHKLFILAGTPYFYENGAYKIDKSGTRLKTLIKGCILPRFIKSTTITRIYQLFLQDYELEKNYEEINQFPEYWIPFKDCMYDVKTEERLSHKPEYYCINQIPWNFPEGESIGVETEKFLSSAMNAEDRKTIFQYLGLCMTRLNFQKFLILKGSRGTGKSVVIHMFESVIGTGNYSNVPLQKLEEKFYSIQLLGKLLNLCADINASPLKTVNSIKLITGGDTLSDSFKGKDIITFAPYARLFFSCNAVPLSLDEKSNALFERIVLIEMDNRPVKPDRQLINKIKKKYTGTPESLEKAVQEYEDELVGDRREYIDFSLSEEYDRLLKLHFHDAVERLDQQQGDTPDKTEHPVLDSQPLASELIADFKAKLQIAEADRDNFYNQKSVYQMQLDVISFVLRIADPIMLKEIYADTKVSYEKQMQEV